MEKKALPILVLPLLFVGCGTRIPPVQAAAATPLADDPSNTDSPIIIADSSTGPIIVEGSPADNRVPKTRTERTPGYFSISNDIFKLSGSAQLIHSRGGVQGPYRIGTFEVTTAGSTACFDLSKIKGWSLFFNKDTKMGSTDNQTVYLANADMTGSPTRLKFALDQQNTDQQNALTLTRPGGPLTDVLLSTDAQGNGQYVQSFPPANYTAPSPGNWKIQIHYCKGGGPCGPACP